MRKTFLIASLVATLLAVPTLASADEISDGTLKLKVKLALLNELGTDSLKIEVDANDGVVDLDGTVGKRETAELAATIAKSVEGVSRVDNSVEVAAPAGQGAVGRAATEAEAEVKDGVLESQIRLALIDELGTDGFRVGTEAASGVVTLEFGPELDKARRAQAVAVVEGVEGVTRVLSVDKN